jgi:hypothetical protein
MLFLPLFCAVIPVFCCHKGVEEVFRLNCHSQLFTLSYGNISILLCHVSFLNGQSMHPPSVHLGLTQIPLTNGSLRDMSYTQDLSMLCNLLLSITSLSAVGRTYYLCLSSFKMTKACGIDVIVIRS